MRLHRIVTTQRPRSGREAFMRAASAGQRRLHDASGADDAVHPGEDSA